MLIIDAHLDLAYNVGRGRDVRMPAREQPIAENEIATVGFPDLRTGDVRLICATIFCNPKTPKHAGYTSPQEAYDQAFVQLDRYDAWFAEGELKRWAGEVEALHTPRAKIHATILLEGAEAIRTIEDAQWFYDRGVRIVGLSWQRTRYAGGTATPGPLTAEGKVLVKELDRLGIIHDASHLAEQSFWDLMQATGARVIASHSNCRAIVGSDPNERHLSDDMIRAIVGRDGVIGINFFDKFMLPAAEYGKRRATLADVSAHMKRICDLAGSAKHVAIGTDMDGGLGREQIPVEIETAADMPRIAEKLSADGFSDEDVKSICHGNWLRVLGGIR
jgi:membrane dipeptidase